MEKNKLGIVINTTKANNRTSGFRAIYRFNDDEWSSVVRDTGAELKKVTNNSASAPIHLIQFESNGCCYCIMQSIAGRKDYQSAWIFIHKDIFLPKGELSSIIQKVEEVLSLDIEDKKAELDTLFGKTYQTENKPNYSVSSGDGYAVRYYGNGTELMYTRDLVLEDYLYQSEYCKYKSVFLIDKESRLQVSDAQDLSDTRLLKCFVIELPTELYGFKHNLGAESLRVTEGTVVHVRWTRPGYAPVYKEGRKSNDLLLRSEDRKRSFRLNMFRVVDKVTKKELNVRPKFKGLHWFDDKRNPTVVFFREDDLNSISCSVKLQTYEPFCGSLDLTQPNEKGEYVIKLQPEPHIYKFCIDTNIPDVRTFEFEIKTQYKLNGTEIPGFQFENPSETRVNRLKGSRKQGGMAPVRGDAIPIRRSRDTSLENSGSKAKGRNKKDTPWLKYILGFVVVILVLIICYQYAFPSDKQQRRGIVAEEHSDSTLDGNPAVEYLRQNNTKWIESEMERYHDLKGVYAMIRDFQFKKLKSFIDSHPDLKEISEWERLYEIVEKNHDKKGTWPNDGSIDVEEYLTTDFESKEDAQENDDRDNKQRETNGQRKPISQKNGSTKNTGDPNSKGGTNGSNEQDRLN